VFYWFLSTPSCEVIAERLTDLHIPTPTQIHQTLKWYQQLPETEREQITSLSVKIPKKWGGTSVRKILLNPFYAGLRIWNRYENRLKRIRSPEAWIFKHDSHPGLISPEKFQEVDQLFEEVGRNR